MSTPIPLRASTPADDARVRAFLEAEGLPAADVETGRQEYLLAEEDGRLVGTVGLEQVGKDALIRSLAVAPDRRGRGVAARLDAAAVARARALGVSTLYLLTTTAQAYAARQGYERIARTEVPPGILALPQFKALCPATAVCMRRPLDHSAMKEVPRRRVWLTLLLHALAIWVACAATMGVGMALTSMQTTLVIHAAGAPMFAGAVSAFYFRRFGYTSPLVTASAVLATIVLVDFFLVGLVINRSLDMFRSVLGTWLPFLLIFLATATAGWAVRARRLRAG